MEYCLGRKAKFGTGTMRTAVFVESIMELSQFRIVRQFLDSFVSCLSLRPCQAFFFFFNTLATAEPSLRGQNGVVVNALAYHSGVGDQVL